MYPDFIFAMTADGAKQRLLIIEMKGNQLDNPDSKYKQKLLDLCSNMFTWENVTTIGELELVYDPATTVTCALVYEDHWKTNLTGIIGT